MNSGSDIAAIAALLGDPACANMLSALMDGGARSAGDLAFAAHGTPQTASAHLGKLAGTGLLTLQQRGCHRYYRLASAEVARLLEQIMMVAAVRTPRYRPAWMREEALRSARTCYDHLAGRLGVALTDSLVRCGHVRFDHDGGELTPAGSRFLADWGLDLDGLAGRRCRFCRPCVDWSERRPHLGGEIGAALAERCFALGWIERIKDTRAVAITGFGRDLCAQFSTRHQARSPIGLSSQKAPTKPGTQKIIAAAGRAPRSDRRAADCRGR